MVGEVAVALAAGAVAGLGIAMPVGAIGTFLVALGARAPHRVAAAAALGVGSTDGIYAAVAVTGGAALQHLLRPAATTLKWASVAALAMLAGITVRAGVRRYRDGASPRWRGEFGPVRAYLTLLGLTALNPATLAYFSALVLGHQASSTAHAAQRVAFVIGAFVASAAWQLTLVAAGAVVGHVVGGRRGQLAIAGVSGAVMLGLAVVLALG